jgi:hypothetical protein
MAFMSTQASSSTDPVAWTLSLFACSADDVTRHPLAACMHA